MDILVNSKVSNYSKSDCGLGRNTKIQSNNKKNIVCLDYIIHKLIGKDYNSFDEFSNDLMKMLKSSIDYYTKIKSKIKIIFYLDTKTLKYCKAIESRIIKQIYKIKSSNKI